MPTALHTHPLIVHVVAILALATVSGIAAPEPAQNAEVKLREQLRNAIIQLRTAENDKAASAAALEEAQSEKKELEEKLTELSKQSAKNQDAANKSIAELKEQLANAQLKLASVNMELSRTQTAEAQASALARKTEAERAKLETEKFQLQNKVADHQRKNLELYRVAMDVLKRFEKFAFGEVVIAKEPFIGTARVKIENLMESLKEEIAKPVIPPDPAPKVTKTAQPKSPESGKSGKPEKPAPKKG
jgi:DNA repair exonuclease SbcCD ATPase subunit